MTLNRQFPPDASAIPDKEVAAALVAYQEATTAARDSAREFEEIVRMGREAAVRDRAATAAALTEGEAVPAPVHQRQHEERVEQAQRIRDARRELADASWSRFESVWKDHTDEMLDAIAKADQRDRAEYTKAVDRLEAITARRAARASLWAALGGPFGPADMLAISADGLRAQDGPGRGLFWLTDVVKALRQVGLPEPERVAAGENLPLSAQGAASPVVPGGGPA